MARSAISIFQTTFKIFRQAMREEAFLCGAGRVGAELRGGLRPGAVPVTAIHAGGAAKPAAPEPRAKVVRTRAAP